MKQSTGHVLMVRPAAFGFNSETPDNNFQNKNAADADVVLDEFDNMVNLLRNAGITVTVIKDTVQPQKPDAIFPNNWFSTSPGKLIVYPMYALNRRAERRNDIIEMISGGKEVIDLSEFELTNEYLEGTGGLVLDHISKKAFAAVSNRTHPRLVREWCSVTGYKPVMFQAMDNAEVTIYHTNVMMCIGTGYAVVCLEAVRENNERKNLEKELVESGLEIIEITLNQVNAFAGNMIELEGFLRRILMSESALASLLPLQLETIKKYAAPLPVPIPTIETIGGGSVRCMVAELF